MIRELAANYRGDMASQILGSALRRDGSLAAKSTAVLFPTLAARALADDSNAVFRTTVRWRTPRVSGAALCPILTAY